MINNSSHGGPMSKPVSGVNHRSLGLELQRLRKESSLNATQVGEAVGMHHSTISRLESGKRPATTSEEVASILTAIGAKGVIRAELIEQARRLHNEDLIDTAGSTEQSRHFLNFEPTASKITDFELMLVPGLAQIPDYAHAVISALVIDDADADIEAWVKLRISRQVILTRRHPPKLHWIMTEVGLRQPMGGAKTMVRQINHLIDLADRPNITINIVPKSVVAHPGISGPFVVLGFVNDPMIVHVEAMTSGLFLDDPAKVGRYTLAAEKLTDLALDPEESVRLMRSIAGDLDQE
jgi:transcriptional regulator with XRE-family HTH domain